LNLLVKMESKAVSTSFSFTTASIIKLGIKILAVLYQVLPVVQWCLLLVVSLLVEHESGLRV